MSPLLMRRLCWLVPIVLVLLAGAAEAQQITISLDDGPGFAGRAIQLLALLTILSLVPGLAIMVTCFPFLVTVFAILRQALGLMQSPPNMLLISLALFLTYFVMEPVFLAAWTDGVEPLVAGTIEVEAGISAIVEPFRGFMAARVDPETLASLAELRADAPAQDSLSILIPAFMLSEVARAFEIGFVVFLPFLVIDLIVAAVLMSMGMMMVPPAIVSLPFKLAFFVVADGWTLLATALVQGYL